MDYSSIHENDDLPTGASPWASSPQQHRNRNSTDRPPSPTPAPLGPQAEGSTEYQSRASNGDENVLGQPADTGEDAPPEQASIPYRPQQSVPPEEAQQHQQQRQHPDGHARHPQHRPNSSRSDQRQRPKYNLSAKVNGLERSGRKDPMLRFDVYVGCSFASRRRLLMFGRRPISQASVPHSSEMCVDLMVNSRT